MTKKIEIINNYNVHITFVIVCQTMKRKRTSTEVAPRENKRRKLVAAPAAPAQLPNTLVQMKRNLHFQGVRCTFEQKGGFYFVKLNAAGRSTRGSVDLLSHFQAIHQNQSKITLGAVIKFLGYSNGFSKFNPFTFPINTRNCFLRVTSSCGPEALKRMGMHQDWSAMSLNKKKEAIASHVSGSKGRCGKQSPFLSVTTSTAYASVWVFYLLSLGCENVYVWVLSRSNLEIDPKRYLVGRTHYNMAKGAYETLFVNRIPSNLVKMCWTFKGLGYPSKMMVYR